MDQGATGWSGDYEFDGRFRVDSDTGAAGVTFCSGYPNEDRYYRLGAAVGSTFQVTARKTSITSGDVLASTMLLQSTWYRFRIVVSDEGTETWIRAKVWAEGLSEPSAWAIDCVDSSSDRCDQGTVGCWASGTDLASFDDFSVDSQLIDFPQPESVEIVTAGPVLFVGETTPVGVVARYEDQDLDLTEHVTWSGFAGSNLEISTGSPTTITPSGTGTAIVQAEIDGLAADPLAVVSETSSPIAAGSWVDTLGGNSFAEDDSLFRVVRYGSQLVFRTTSTLTNIHSHFENADALDWSVRTFTGRILVDDPDGGVGVTFLSAFPTEDRYYRLRRFAGESSFRIAPHGSGVLSGKTDSGVVPAPDVWYRFRVAIEDTGSATLIRARIWAADDIEPWSWQIDCVDDSSDRITAGSAGCWSMGPGAKYWRDLAVDATPVPLPQPTAVEIDASSTALELGEAASLTLSAIYPEGDVDVTPEAQWSVTPPGILDLVSGNPAQVVATNPGAATVVGTFGETESAPSTITVDDPDVTLDLVGITIAGLIGPLDIGESVGLTATGEYSDGSFADITSTVAWSVADSTIAQLSSSPVVLTALAEGSTTLTAFAGGITSDPLGVTVLPPPTILESIAISGPTSMLSVGDTAELTATATYSDGTVADVTSKVTFEASDPAIVSIGSGVPVVLTALASGTTEITASLAGVVSPPIVVEVETVLTSVVLSVQDSTLSIGESTEAVVYAQFSDGSSVDVTTNVTWWVGNSNVVSVAAGSPAIVTAETAGTSLIAASYGALGTAAVSMEVAGGTPTLSQLSLVASATEIDRGASALLTLTGEFSDGSSVPLTAQGTYTASPSGIIFLFPAAPGVAIGVNEGTAVVTASFLGLTSNSVTLTVVDPAPPSGSLPDTAPWVDTQPGSLVEADSLFGVALESGDLIFKTDSADTNIHSHLVPPGGPPLAYQEFAGSIKFEDSNGGVGVTFFSSYPAEDRYYRLRRYAGSDFHIAPHGTTISGGDNVSGVYGSADQWQRYRIQVTDTGSRTEIRAKVWWSGGTEPSSWQINCFDENATRLTSGTVGVWSMGPGSKSWRDMEVDTDSVPLPQPFVLDIAADDTLIQVGDQIELTALVSDPAGTQDVSSEVNWIVDPSDAFGVTTGTPAIFESLEFGVVQIRAEYDGYESAPLTVTILPSGGSSGAGSSSQVTRGGITWFFDAEYPVGEFANGDFWVVGPVSIVAIDPPSVQVGARTKNGSMLNPMPQGATHGYDSTLFGSYAGTNYDPDLNVAFGVSPGNPLVIPPMNSLVSTASPDSTQFFPPGIESAAVLTVLDAPPPDGSFRPPYTGTNKPIYNVAQLETDLLQTLPMVSGAPSVPSMVDQFDNVWLDHVEGWLGRFAHPAQNMPDYGRDMSIEIGKASLLLHLDLPMSEKFPLLVRFVQLGIDLDGLLGVGQSWVPAGGHAVGRKWPIMFKRAMFGEQADLQTSVTKFSEDGQTFYVQETSPGTYNYGYGGYGSAQVGMPEWGEYYWVQNPQGSDGFFDWSENNYRVCCTFNASGGHFLSALIMGLRDEWDWEPAFDYMDRYMQMESGWTRQMNQWTEDVWDAYRNNYPGNAPIPAGWWPPGL